MLFLNAPMPGGSHIVLSPRLILKILIAANIVLVVMSLCGEWIAQVYLQDVDPESLSLKIIQRFDVNAEKNIPTWFQTSLIMVSALILSLITLERWQRRSRYRWHWVALTVLVTFFSLDEAAALHDGLTPIVRALMDADGVFYFGWVVPAIALLAVIAATAWHYYAHIPTQVRRTFILAICIYFIGAVGFEMAGGLALRVLELPRLAQASIWHLEELAEMMGMAIFLYGTLNYASLEHIALRIQPDARPAPAATPQR